LRLIIPNIIFLSSVNQTTKHSTIGSLGDS